MANLKSIGAIELSSIGIGYQIEDEMLKAASVDLLIARSICSGKYLIIIGGSVSDVEAAVQTGLAAAGEAIIDHLIIPTFTSRSSQPSANRSHSTATTTAPWGSWKPSVVPASWPPPMRPPRPRE